MAEKTYLLISLLQTPNFFPMQEKIVLKSFELFQQGLEPVHKR